jgi:hypothetical protein
MKAGGSISIWFFIGVSLVVNGALIFVTGLSELSHPPAVVLANLHASVWWGALMLVVGAFYCYFFAPSRYAARMARTQLH